MSDLVSSAERKLIISVQTSVLIAEVLMGVKKMNKIVAIFCLVWIVYGVWEMRR